MDKLANLDPEVQAEIKSITQQIIYKYQPEKIILFGSAARGEFGTDSDLDFCIIKKTLPKTKHERGYQLYKSIQKNIAADFISYTPEEYDSQVQTKNPFFDTIEKQGLALYG